MPADEMLIRQLKQSDYPALVELIRRTWYAQQADGNTDGLEPTCDARHRNTLAWHLAAIDAYDCLARTTYAAVVERNGRIIGVILGSVPAKVTRMQILRHRWQQASLALPMLANRAGRNGLREQLAILHADRALIQTTGNDYQAEIVLFLVSPEAKGQGVGGRLFAHMLDRFHALGIRQYFLFTDTTCDYGFYEHKGLQRAGVRNLALAHGEQLQCFLYQGRVNDKER